MIGSEYEVIMHHGPPLECNICYELMQDGQQIALLNCYCQFHAECLEQWWQKRTECPVHCE